MLAKTRLLALALAWLALGGATAAAPPPPELEAPADLRVIVLTERDGLDYPRFVYTVPESVKRVMKEWSVDFRVELRENEGPWITAATEYPETYLDPMLEQVTGELTCAFYRNGKQRTLALEQNNYEFRACFSIGNTERSPYSNTVSLGYASPAHAGWVYASEWAVPELESAYGAGLIPQALLGADMTGPITRGEFAAVAVALYENLAGGKAASAETNPFTDTGDADVLKAYNLGIATGTSANKFNPLVQISREEAAAMLTRVVKAAYIPGWTLAEDGGYKLNFTQPAKFADDDRISGWAKSSVYFMAANGFMSGVDGGVFAPKAVTADEQARNYASATREQALSIAVRMADKLKGKPLDYSYQPGFR